MIKKLQTKFVLLSMSALLAVLCVIVGGINAVNYSGMVRQADQVLELLSENKGAFPKGDVMKDHHLPPEMSPELPYETRFFSVVLNSDTGEAISTETRQIISVDDRQARLFAREVFEGGEEQGFLGAFRYIRTREGENSRIIFLDCGRKLDFFREFLLGSILIALAGFLLVFFIVSFFAHRIIRPISESYEKQKRFITDAGHEIKTPLTIISANVDVLEEDLGGNEWLEDIRRQTRRLTGLTRDLVQLARMEEESRPACMVEFPLSDLVEETAHSFVVLAQTQGKTLEIQIEPMLSMEGDAKAIQKLVSILLDNALKYSPEGGKLALSLERQGKNLLLKVSNPTREPVAREELDKLFDRFYRTDPSRNSETGGYGIGLSMARAITQSHGGKIWASAKDENALLMQVRFPAV